MNRGFTLIETIIYIALLGLLMGGGVVVAYQLLQGTGTVDTKNTVQEEGNFVLAKMRYALGSASGVDSVSGALEINRYGNPQVRVRRSVDALEFSEDGGGSYLPITTENVTVSDFALTILPPASGAPEGVIATTTINGIDFVLTAYVRN